jgi:hypothetical protein
MKDLKQFILESERVRDFKNEWEESWNEAANSGSKEKIIDFYESLLDEILDEEWHHKSHTPNREEKEVYSFLLNLKIEVEDAMESEKIDYVKIYTDFKKNWKEPKY